CVVPPRPRIPALLCRPVPLWVPMLLRRPVPLRAPTLLSTPATAPTLASACIRTGGRRVVVHTHSPLPVDVLGFAGVLAGVGAQPAARRERGECGGQRYGGDQPDGAH